LNVAIHIQSAKLAAVILIFVMVARTVTAILIGMSNWLKICPTQRAADKSQREFLKVKLRVALAANANPFGRQEIIMEKLTESEIRTLQLALDNMADDGVLDSGIEMLMALHNKLDRIAAEQKRAADSAKAARLARKNKSKSKKVAPAKSG